MTSFFTDVITRTDDARRAFETNPVVVDAVAAGMSLERYRSLLSEIYHIVWHFNPTCAAAASRLGDDLAGVRYFLYQHMHEESGHERWVMSDLEAVGFSRESLADYRPSSQALALIGYNYWSADRRDPCSVLGMMYVLEVIAAVYGGPFAAAIKEGLFLQGDNGISFLVSHASMDAQHMASLREILNLVTNGRSQAAVLESIEVNFHHVTSIFSAI